MRIEVSSIRALFLPVAALVWPEALSAQERAPDPQAMPMDRQPKPQQQPIGAPANPEAAPAPRPSRAAVTTLPNLDERQKWPSPTADDANYSYLLVDLLEFREGRTPGIVRWDVFGWYGGDIKRVWIKTEGAQSIGRKKGGEQEAQILYGQLITPFFDLQAGVRYAHRSGAGANRSRTYAVAGLQGLAPYRYELEPSLFLSNKGHVSARVTASYDLLLTQRLIIQPRIELNLAAQSDRQFETGSGLTSTELGARIRYEIRREFAPYLGLSWSQLYGGTKRLAREGGEDSSVLVLVAGVRMWF
jgi:copper resistance protein B